MSSDLVGRLTKWFIDEGFEVKKLSGPPQLKVVWGLDTYTPPPLKVNIKVFQPTHGGDKVVFLLGVSVAPEHRSALGKLEVNEKIRFSSKLLRTITCVCNDCATALQPNPVDLQAITVAKPLYISEIEDKGKPIVMGTIARLINSFLAIISTFNEEFPEAFRKGRGGTATTHI
ncbi:MAG: DUF2299 family protein [Desulfurococcales archaeon]|nr:DUF2299 family protein [Desulfurococcales archaeon]